MNNHLKKRALIAFTVVIILAIIYGILHFMPAQKQPSTSTQDPTPLISEATPSYPKPSTSSANSNNSDLKQNFFQFIQQRTPAPQTSEQSGIWEFTDESKRPLTLDALSASLGLSIHPSVRLLLDQNDSQIFSFARSDNQKDFGLILYSAPSDLPQKEFTIALKNEMRSWEPTMLKDIHAVLFPTITFSPDQLSQSLEFRDGDSRYATVQLPDGTTGSINYTVYGGPIIIASSIESLKTAEDSFFDTQED